MDCILLSSCIFKKGNSLPYSNILHSGKLQAKVENTNKIVKAMAQQNEIKKDSVDEKERMERTLVIKKYTDPKIRKSPQIHESIYKEYPGVVIRNARTTAGGSILIELDDKETANKVRETWNKDLFGGNKGAVNLKKTPPAGIVKHIPKSTVDDETTEEDLINEIRSKYPNANVDLFKRNEKFTGTLKIEFNSEEEFQTALKNRVQIFEQRYIMERYHYRPRVIICKYCQKFGHVSFQFIGPRLMLEAF